MKNEYDVTVITESGVIGHYIDAYDPNDAIRKFMYYNDIKTFVSIEVREIETGKVLLSLKESEK